MNIEIGPDFDQEEDVTELLLDGLLIDLEKQKSPKAGRQAMIRHRIEDLLDQRRLIEEFLPFDDEDF